MAVINIPYQEFVVLRWDKGLLVFQPEDTLGPPVDRMKSVLVAHCEYLEVEPLQQIQDFFMFEDPYMPAGRIVVLVGYFPADRLGKIGRYAYGQYPAGF